MAGRSFASGSYTAGVRTVFARLFAPVRSWRFRAGLSRSRRPAPQQREGCRNSEQDATSTRLRQYEEEIQRLRLENEQLRASATGFGELAERLNQALRNGTRSAGRGHTPIPRSR